MEDENKNTGVDTTVIETKEEKKTLDELLASNKEMQSDYDKKVAQAMKTRLDNERKKWEEEQKNKQAEAEKLAKMDEEQKINYQLQEAIKRAEEAEKKLSSRDLETETIKQANSKGIPLELIQTIDFGKETAESIASKLAIFEKTSKTIAEKVKDEYSREDPPQTGDKVDSQKDKSKMTYEELAKLPEYNK